MPAHVAGSTSSGNASTARACSSSLASRSHAGRYVRTIQSVTIQPRRSSSAGPVLVPTTLAMYGTSFWRPSSSRSSFQRRRKAPMTGETHWGWSPHGSWAK